MKIIDDRISNLDEFDQGDVIVSMNSFYIVTKDSLVNLETGSVISHLNCKLWKMVKVQATMQIND